MGYQIVGAAVEVVSSHDVVTGLRDVLQGVGDRSSSRSDCKTSDTAFKSCHTVFEDALGGIGKTAVDVAGVAEAEAVGRVLRVVENIGSGLVDGNGACISCGVGLFLSYVKLQCFEAVILAHGRMFLIVFRFLSVQRSFCFEFLPMKK